MKKNRLLRRAAAIASAVVLIGTGVAYAQNQTAQPTAQTRVISVYDGDTFRADINGQSIPVRVLGIDSPELDPKQCYGIEARDAARQLLQNQVVTLTPDPQQGDHDRYQRKLRYVTLPDGTDFAKTMLTEGAAKVFEQYPVAKTPQYEQAQTEAQRGNRGMWGQCR